MKGIDKRSMSTLNSNNTNNQIHGGIAQLGERLPCKQEVSGSNPLTSTILKLEVRD